MKFKTFRALVIGGAVLLGGVGIFFIGRAINNRKPEPAIDLTPKLAHGDAHGDAALPSGPSSSPGGGSNTVDYREHLPVLLGRPAGGETKIKDLYKGKGVKINLYADAEVWNRAKVDIDRDDKWDEKWFIEDGVVFRAVAPNDDENYGPDRAVNAPAAEAPSSGSDASTPAPKSELRDVDTLMLELLERPVQEKIKDASKGRPFKINLYSDDKARFNRAKVDLDRDDKWDEKWTFATDGTIEREVAPGDDENYTQRFVLEAGVRWQTITP